METNDNSSYSFDAYQQATRVTAEYPMREDNMIYPALKLAGEAGELADKIGKHWRNKGKEYRDSKKMFGIGSQEIHAMSAKSLTPEQKAEIIKEMGDVLWYIAALADELEVPLSIVAATNINKTHDRKKRGVVCSEGDNR